MNNGKFFIFTMVVLILLTACNQESLSISMEPSKGYSKEEAIKRGDLVSTALGKGYKNKESFIVFFNNVKNGKEDKVRRTHYSLQGSPLFTDLIYTDGKIHVLIDTTNAFQVPEDYLVKTHDICSEIEKKEKDNKIIFTLDDCTSSSRQVEKLFKVIFEKNKKQEN